MREFPTEKSAMCVGFALLMASVFLSGAVADSGPEHQAYQARPIELGTSGGNINDRSTLYCCSGTLGSLVEDAGGTQYILSNNHVLARSNEAVFGEEVNQPGQVDQSCGQSGIVADLSDFVPIAFRQGRSRPENLVDAAIAKVRDGLVRTDGSILDIGTVSADIASPFIGQGVRKSGRTTGSTTGTVAAIDVTVDVGYSQECGGAANHVARFVQQIRITPGEFSAAGDSGSLIVESGSASPNDGLPRALALLFAGSSSSTLANPIDAVLNSLGVSMVGGSPLAPGPTGSVSGVVTDASDGTAIVGATVSMDTGQSATTGGDGSYLIEGVPAGDQTAMASAIGYQSESQPVSVSDGGDTQADFALTPAETATQSVVQCVTYNTEGGNNGDKHLLITVSVMDDMGALLPNASVSVSVTLNGAAFGSASGTTNSAGEVSFTAKNAANGTYTTAVADVVSGSLAFEGTTPTNAFNKGTDAVPASFCQSGLVGSATPEDSNDMPLSLAQARRVNARHSDRLMAIPGVVGHGVGLSKSGRPVIEVYLENENAATRAKVPSALENVPVKAVVTGAFEAY